MFDSFPINHGFYLVEVSNLLAVTKPKIIFCEATNIGLVREALNGLGMVTPIYLFGKIPDGETDVNSVDELLTVTGTEQDFV